MKIDKDFKIIILYFCLTLGWCYWCYTTSTHGYYTYFEEKLIEKQEENVIIPNNFKQLTYKEAFIKKMLPLIDNANNSLSKEGYKRIPVSLVLSQAIIESNWGRSRFANEYNNLFGIHEYKQTGKRPIKKYKTKQESVIDYMRLLHTGSHFQKFRDLLFYNEDSFILKEGLLDYSEKGRIYLNLIENVINDNNLKQYD